MDARELDRPITIESATIAPDDAGGSVKTWNTFVNVFAKLMPIGGLELFAAQQVNAQFDAKFRIRFMSGITPDMRILYDGQYYEIVTKPTEVGRRQWLDIRGRILQA